MKLNIHLINEEHFNSQMEELSKNLTVIVPIDTQVDSTTTTTDITKNVNQHIPYNRNNIININQLMDIKNIIKSFNFFIKKTLHSKYQEDKGTINYFKNINHYYLNEYNNMNNNDIYTIPIEPCKCCSHFQYKHNITIDNEINNGDSNTTNETTTTTTEDEFTTTINNNYINKEVIDNIILLINSILKNKENEIVTTTTTTTNSTTKDNTITENISNTTTTTTIMDENNIMDENKTNTPNIDDSTLNVNSTFSYKKLKHIENTLRRNKPLIDIYFIISSFMIEVEKNLYNQFFKLDKLCIKIMKLNNSITEEDKQQQCEHTCERCQQQYTTPTLLNKTCYYVHDNQKLNELNEI
jgi:hypothetical protein